MDSAGAFPCIYALVRKHYRDVGKTYHEDVGARREFGEILMQIVLGHRAKVYFKKMAAFGINDGMTIDDMVAKTWPLPVAICMVYESVFSPSVVDPSPWYAALRALADWAEHELLHFRGPAVAADAVVIRGTGKDREALVIERANEPVGLAFPGGFVDYGETTEGAAARELCEETLLEALSVRPIGTFTDPERDPRQHVISFAYLIEVRDDANPVGSDDARRAMWVRIADLDVTRLVFDHAQILERALEVRESTLTTPDT